MDIIKIAFNLFCRTRVECGGQCKLTASCHAFTFSDDHQETICQLFDATYLFADKNDNSKNAIYIEKELWESRGK